MGLEAAILVLGNVFALQTTLVTNVKLTRAHVPTVHALLKVFALAKKDFRESIAIIRLLVPLLLVPTADTKPNQAASVLVSVTTHGPSRLVRSVYWSLSALAAQNLTLFAARVIVYVVIPASCANVR